MEYMAFSVYQPYAYAIVAGLKGYETRRKRTNVRGRVAVYATKTKQDFEVDTRAAGIKPGTVFHLGAVIGTVEIVDCVPVEEIMQTLTERERLLGDYSPGRFAWVLKNPIMFEKPIPARGQQGWWHWRHEWKEPEETRAEDTPAEDPAERILQEINKRFREFLGAPYSEAAVVEINERTAQIVKELYINGEIGLGPTDGDIWLGEVPLEILPFIPYAISEIGEFGKYRVLQKGKIIGFVSYGGPPTQDTPGTVNVGARTSFTPAEKVEYIGFEFQNLSDLGSDESDECRSEGEPE